MKVIIKKITILSILILTFSCSESSKNSETERYEEKLEREAEAETKVESEAKNEKFKECMSGTTYAGYAARRNRCSNEIN